MNEKTKKKPSRSLAEGCELPDSMVRLRPRRRELLRGSALLAAGAALSPALQSCASAPPPRAIRQLEEYRSYDAVGLAELVRRGEADPRELLEYAIQSAEASNPSLNFMAVRLYDHARQSIIKGLPAGPLAGVPYLLKDLGVHLEGTRTTAGSRLFQDFVSSFTSTIVHRYQQAGLVIFGRTTSPELGKSVTTESLLFGATRNPWNTSLSSGGSSGGAAAAVAAGVLPAAHATDGGGSIRIPASFCGLFGLKPSRGRTPLGPNILEANAGLSVGHAVTRTVRDSAALLDVTQGVEPGATNGPPPPKRPYLEEIKRAPGRLRIAVPGNREDADSGNPPLHPDCVAALRETATLCRELGHEVVQVPTLNISLEKAAAAVGTIFSVGDLLTVQPVERMRGQPVSAADLEPLTLLQIEAARKITGTQYLAARYQLEQIAIQMARFMQNFDLILTPTMAAPPPPLGYLDLGQKPEDFQRRVLPFVAYTGLYNVTGQPAISVPLYWNAAQLPIGTMFAARFGDEATLFRLAAQLEKARPWRERRPLMAG